MRSHGRMQAIARVNRVLKDKQEMATQTVLQQAELLCADWAGEAVVWKSRGCWTPVFLDHVRLNLRLKPVSFRGARVCGKHRPQRVDVQNCWVLSGRTAAGPDDTATLVVKTRIAGFCKPTLALCAGRLHAFAGNDTFAAPQICALANRT